MRILVVSEGRHELGPSPEASPLVELTRKLLGRDAEFSCDKVSNPKVRIHFPRGKAEAYERRALAWIRYATSEEFDALVLVIDQDGKSERERGIEHAQVHAALSLPRAMGVAIRTFDAWMLADEQTLSEVLNCRIRRQKSPESIRDPKRVCQTLLASNGSGLALGEFYFRITLAADLNRLARRCRRGFAPFKSRVEALAVDD